MLCTGVVIRRKKTCACVRVCPSKHPGTSFSSALNLNMDQRSTRTVQLWFQPFGRFVSAKVFGQASSCSLRGPGPEVPFPFSHWNKFP